MTGTAMTEEEEFSEIYKLDVVEIPTNRPMIREDCPDVVYKTAAAKYKAVIDDIVEHHEKGQPVLVGTITIEKSELLSKMLKQRGVKHEVLNAKFHEKEAQIVAQAGRKGAVTIATNMAGRGTDILLGGNAEFMAKAEMQRMGFTEEQLVESTAYSHTEDEEILKAGRPSPSSTRNIRPRSPPKPSWSGSWGACISSAPSATSPAVSTTSSGAVPAARATRAKAGFISPWRTT